MVPSRSKFPDPLYFYSLRVIVSDSRQIRCAKVGVGIKCTRRCYGRDQGQITLISFEM